MVFFALFTQPRAIEEDGCRRLERTRVEMPIVGREQPGPSQHVAVTNRLNDGGAVIVASGFDGNASALDEIKAIRQFSFPKDYLAGRELGQHSHFSQEFQKLR